MPHCDVGRILEVQNWSRHGNNDLIQRYVPPLFFLWSIDQCPREKSYPDFKSNAFDVDVVGGLLVVSGVPTHAAKSVAATKIVKPFVHAKQVQNGTQRHVPKPGEQHTTVGTMVRQFQNQNQVMAFVCVVHVFSSIVNTINY